MHPQRSLQNLCVFKAILLAGLMASLAQPALAQRATSSQPDAQSAARLQRPDPPSTPAPNQPSAATTPIAKTDSRTFATFPRTYNKAYGPNVIDRSADPGQSAKGQAYNVKARNLPRGVTRP
jgi:hypothetical protein